MGFLEMAANINGVYVGPGLQALHHCFGRETYKYALVGKGGFGFRIHFLIDAPHRVAVDQVFTAQQGCYFITTEMMVITAQRKNSTPSSFAKISNAVFSNFSVPHSARKFARENATINRE